MSHPRCPHCNGEIVVIAAHSPTAKALQSALVREPLFPVVVAACREFGAPIEALLTGSAASHVVRARMVASVILRDDHHLSYPAIGRLLECDHSTVMGAYKRYHAIVAKDPGFAVHVTRTRSRVPQESEVPDAAE